MKWWVYVFLHIMLIIKGSFVPVSGDQGWEREVQRETLCLGRQILSAGTSFSSQDLLILSHTVN